jgi:hypothetical protein
VEVGGSQVQAILGKNTRPYVKNKTKAKRDRGISQVVKHLLGKHEALSSKPSNEKKKNCHVLTASPRKLLKSTEGPRRGFERMEKVQYVSCHSALPSWGGGGIDGSGA